MTFSLSFFDSMCMCMCQMTRLSKALASGSAQPEKR